MELENDLSRLRGQLRDVAVELLAREPGGIVCIALPERAQGPVVLVAGNPSDILERLSILADARDCNVPSQSH